MFRRHETSVLSRSRSGKLNFDENQLNAFSAKIAGRIVLPQDASYNSDRQPFICGYHSYPQIIVYCVGHSDVLACLRFAKEVGLKVAVRAGGHNAAGYSVNDEMVVDVSGIYYVHVDPVAETAKIGGGSNFAKIYAELDVYGMHIPGGGCETVSVGGFMQGGGYSFTSQMFGMNCDNVTGVQVALADGRIVRANAEENEDLFWAVRGATGNNFGVVLEIEYKVRKLGELWGFGFKWPLTSDETVDKASTAAAAWQAYFCGDNTPPNFSTQSQIAYTRETPDAEESHPYFIVRGMFNGTEEECRKALEPLYQHAPDTEGRRDIWQAGHYTGLNETMFMYPTMRPLDVPLSSRSIAMSHIMDRYLSAAEWKKLMDFFRFSENTDNFIGLEGYGGAINEPAQDATAFWHRTGTLDIYFYSFWLRESDRPIAEKCMREFDELVEPMSNGHSYQNYPNRWTEDFGTRYFGGNLPRLMEVKQKYDPDNLFDFQQGLAHA
jgi:FAD/FMN-containing dehydrogenase